jgi:PAS domain-containing protein
MNHNRAVERRRNGHEPGQSPIDILNQLPALVVLERIPVPVLAIAHDGALVFANSAFSEMVGRASEDVLLLKFDEIFLLPPASCLLPPASCLLPPASCLLSPNRQSRLCRH